MKKSIIASVILLGMGCGLAHASTGEVIFSGAVTADTCDLAAYSTNGNLLPGGVVQLANVKPNATGPDTTFVLKQRDPACKVAGQTVSIDWSGTTLGPQGFRANPGSLASDALVLLTAHNAKSKADISINSSTGAVDFDAALLNKDGLQFLAKTQGGAQPGNFQSSATFTVAYR